MYFFIFSHIYLFQFLFIFTFLYLFTYLFPHSFIPTFIYIYYWFVYRFFCVVWTVTALTDYNGLGVHRYNKGRRNMVGLFVYHPFHSWRSWFLNPENWLMKHLFKLRYNLYKTKKSTSKKIFLQNKTQWSDKNHVWPTPCLPTHCASYEPILVMLFTFHIQHRWYIYIYTYIIV